MLDSPYTYAPSACVPNTGFVGTRRTPPPPLFHFCCCIPDTPHTLILVLCPGGHVSMLRGCHYRSWLTFWRALALDSTILSLSPCSPWFHTLPWDLLHPLHLVACMESLLCFADINCLLSSQLRLPTPWGGDFLLLNCRFKESSPTRWGFLWPLPLPTTGERCCSFSQAQ